MAGIFGGILESTIRKEMKSRIDEVLRCGREWGSDAKALKASLDNLVAELKAAAAKGVSVDPAAIKEIGPPITRLCKNTDKLAKGFENYTKTMTKISEKL
jgi:hypothetical protein